MGKEEKIGPSGDSIFEARLVRKYGDLRWLDPDNTFSLRISQPERMAFTKARENTKYDVLATMHGFDTESSPEGQPLLYDVWETNKEVFGLITEYYKASTAVKCYEKGGQ